MLNDIKYLLTILKREKNLTINSSLICFKDLKTTSNYLPLTDLINLRVKNPVELVILIK